MNVLLIGSGGREHAMAAKIAESKILTQLYIAPGNAGTAACGINVPLGVSDFPAIKEFVVKNAVELVVVGPEAPLALGIADYFQNDQQLAHVKLVGPSQKGAELEASKDFAKAFMMRHSIPTAAYQTFTGEQFAEASRFMTTLKPPYVLKADGLAAGKGVVIVDTLSEAEEALKAMFDGQFGSAGSKVVIEQFLDGIELSVFALTDGEHYLLLPEAKDYKRIGEGDTGLNTGGMGSVSPVPFADADFMKKVEEQVVKPTIQGLIKEQIPYVGFIFFGLIKVAGEPMVIEYNVRMGDPETESVVPRITSDFLQHLLDAASKNLAGKKIEVTPLSAASVMLVSGGYPEAYQSGKEITGLEKLAQESTAFHAGTKLSEAGVLTNGGRVLAVTCFGKTLKEALENCYTEVDKVKFEGCYYRRDLGQDLGIR